MYLKRGKRGGLELRHESPTIGAVHLLIAVEHDGPIYNVSGEQIGTARVRIGREPSKPPCVHRGEHVDDVECRSCKGIVRLKVYACALHDRCTISKGTVGVTRCSHCPDHSVA